uniref:HTH CENPB-type domain-containing protein n=1 Tax=Glossina pallidipes TaxID=7398 RepID=A0A1A9ZHI3_GLOPL
MEKMEVALSLWIKDRNRKGVPLSGPMVREKTKCLDAHFEDGSYSDECIYGKFQSSEESLEELKPHTLKSCWKKLWPALTAESVQVQTLTANIAEIANGIGRDGIQELLESQDEDLTEIGSGETLTSQPIEEEASTSTGNVIFNLKSHSEGSRMANDFAISLRTFRLWNEVLFLRRKLLMLKTAPQEKITKFFKPLP